METSEPGSVPQPEWLVISPSNIGGYGFLVRSEEGAFGNFFDPSQDVHSDLWARVPSDRTEWDLQVYPWTLSDDGTSITVTAGETPRLKKRGGSA